MSKGLGQLQRRLLAAFETADFPMFAARDLVARELDGLELSEAVRRLHVTDVAVRRALAGLAERGLLVNVGRFARRGERKSAVVYARPALWAELEKGAAEWDAALARRAERADRPTC